MLFILIVVWLPTDVVDPPTFFTFGRSLNTGRLIGIFVFLYFIPGLAALRSLWSQMKGETT